MSTSSVTDSSITDAEYEDDQDWTDPATCQALFERMKGHPTLRVNFDTQRALKRLDEKHFIERNRRARKADVKKWNQDMKKKISNIVKVNNSNKAKKAAMKPKPKKIKGEVKDEDLKSTPEGEALLDDTPKESFDDYLTTCERDFKDPNMTVPIERDGDKGMKAANIPTKRVEGGEPSKPKAEKTDEDLTYDPEIVFDSGETNGKDGTSIICTLSCVIARSPAGSGSQSLERAVHQVVKHYSTGESLNQFDNIPAGLHKIFTLTLIHFSSTCRGLRPMTGTEMRLERTLIQ